MCHEQLRPHLRPGMAGRKLRLAAWGRLTSAALVAAALDPQIAEIYLSGALLSYRDVVETEEFLTPLADMVPGLLRHTDLPEVTRTVAPRQVVLAGGQSGKNGVESCGHVFDFQSQHRPYSIGEIDVPADHGFVVRVEVLKWGIGGV